MLGNAHANILSYEDMIYSQLCMLENEIEDDDDVLDSSMNRNDNGDMGKYYGILIC